MALWLARALGMHYYYYPAINEHAFGVALFSRYPIINVTTYDLPTIVWDRVMLRATIELNSSFWIDVFVTHLGLDDDNRTAQIEYILSQTNLVTRPKVLMGDFNLYENSTQIANVTSVGGFNDTFRDKNPAEPGYTVDSWPIPSRYKRIDYIFARNFTSIVSSAVYKDMILGINASWEFGSDHLPVVTTLQY